MPPTSPITPPPIPTEAEKTGTVVQIATSGTQADQSWKTFLMGHASVIVLLFMCCFIFMLIIHITHHGGDDKLMQFFESHSQTFVGALVGALTSNGIQQMVNKGNNSK